MTTQEIAKKLVAFCQEGKFEMAQRELYADDAISLEPEASAFFDKETKGLKAIIEKGDKFQSMVAESHGCEISEPLVTNASIAFLLKMDITMKGKERGNMEELCVYQVKDDKIISEQFFF